MNALLILRERRAESRHLFEGPNSRVMNSGDKKIENLNSGPNAATDKKGKKRLASHATDKTTDLRRMPKRAAACSDFKEKSYPIPRQSLLVERKKQIQTEERLSPYV
ncbi:hypothetical protein Pfo_011220 [Paulownia fortunei]|nr:hypothetical protein Pfo_011220 [Paulownia fortunei]